MNKVDTGSELKKHFITFVDMDEGLCFYVAKLRDIFLVRDNIATFLREVIECVG